MFQKSCQKDPQLRSLFRTGTRAGHWVLKMESEEGVTRGVGWRDYFIPTRPTKQNPTHRHKLHVSALPLPLKSLHSNKRLFVLWNSYSSQVRLWRINHNYFAKYNKNDLVWEAKFLFSTDEKEYSLYNWWKL